MATIREAPTIVPGNAGQPSVVKNGWAIRSIPTRVSLFLGTARNDSDVTPPGGVSAPQVPPDLS